MRIIHVPLEPYEQRYTKQLCAPASEGGWLERHWCKFHEVMRIEPPRVDEDAVTIKHGSVLDATGRGLWALRQIDILLQMIREGALRKEDVIYFADFWHPGVEALRYAFDQLGFRCRMYATCWAQSVDVYDFTYPMRGWMRPFEQGNGRLFDGVFVANTMLAELCIAAGVAEPERVHVVGLPFDSEQVRGMMPHQPDRRRRVIFTSRWDEEKDPMFFLEVAHTLRNEGIEFLVTTSAWTIRSNNSSLLYALNDAAERREVGIMVGLTKHEYYKALCESSIQFNCAHQDWVSFTLLEAAVAGTYPLYPCWRAFPETLYGRNEFMYPKGKAVAACDAILRNIDTTPALNLNSGWLEFLYATHDKAWKRMLGVLEGKETYEPTYTC